MSMPNPCPACGTPESPDRCSFCHAEFTHHDEPETEAANTALEEEEDPTEGVSHI